MLISYIYIYILDASDARSDFSDEDIISRTVLRGTSPFGVKQYNLATHRNLATRQNKDYLNDIVPEL